MKQNPVDFESFDGGANYLFQIDGLPFRVKVENQTTLIVDHRHKKLKSKDEGYFSFQIVLGYADNKFNITFIRKSSGKISKSGVKYRDKLFSEIEKKFNTPDSIFVKNAKIHERYLIMRERDNLEREVRSKELQIKSLNAKLASLK